MEIIQPFKYLSVVVLPFDIKPASVNQEAFDFEFDYRLSQDLSYFEAFKRHLLSLTLQSKKAIVDDKYHTHFKDLLSGYLNPESSVLNVYQIKPECLFKQFDLSINDKWLADFNDSSYIVVNEFAQIGYFVFAVKMTGKDGVNYTDLLQTDFYRFYTNKKNSKVFKHAMLKSLKGSIELEINASNKLTFEDVITQQLSAICPYIKLRHQKPLLLNLISSTLNCPEKQLQEILYYSIRTQSSNQTAQLEHNLIKTGSGIQMCVLNEGSAIVDTTLNNDNQSNNFSALFNKYFPAFMLVVNQREIMLQINQVSSKISVPDINRCDSDIIAYLDFIKRRIDIYQFKQMFYSASFNDEIARFYSSLQAYMNINVLLQDNKECLKSIYVILENDQRNKAAIIAHESSVKQKKRDFWINATLTGIGCLGLFSFFKDLIPFTLDGQINNYLGHFSGFYKFFSSMAPFILFIGLLRMMRKNN